MKYAAVTGGSSGLGLAIAAGLTRAGYHVTVLSRSRPRAAAAVEALRRAGGEGRVEHLPFDLASFESIREAATALTTRDAPLHVLVNNAGIFWQRGTTKEGFELTRGTNYLGHFLLTDLLLPRLREAGEARIVNVCSDLAARPRTLESDRFVGETGWDLTEAYAESKLALLLHSAELARRLTGTGVTVDAYHPGFVRSDISACHRLAGRLHLGTTPERAAEAALRCLVEPRGSRPSGAYVGRSKDTGAPVQLDPPPLARDTALAKELWERSLKWTGRGPKRSGGPDAYNPEDGIIGPVSLSLDRQALAEAVREVTEILPRAPSALRGLGRLALKGELGSAA